MNECYECGDVIYPSETIRCDTCRVDVCIGCSIGHFIEDDAERDSSEWRRSGEAFFREQDLDEGDW